ncbi:unnamed protein product [Brachionus calyciflorus]|uniref:Uncharacterized protein n=1 Tax=Brachionus calyciflorus TaxID=104777 RepID=A0A814A633_9BILA|nr:unnamed protein product [Brachionus calyciflorus]
MVQNISLNSLLNLLITKFRIKLDKCVEDLENHLNQDHIKKVILDNYKNESTNELKDKIEHGNLILASFDYNPRNLFHGPSNRANDPHHKKNPKLDLNNNTNFGHDTEFLQFQSDQFKNSYQNYVKNKSLRSFSDLDQNKATPSMQKDPRTGAYYHPSKNNSDAKNN